MFRKLFHKNTLLEDLEQYINKVSGTGRDAQILIVLTLNPAESHSLSTALKLRDDLKGLAVTYTDANFILCSKNKNPIGKLMEKHKNNLPPQYIEQRANVSDEHIEGVLYGREEERYYGANSNFYTGVRRN